MEGDNAKRARKIPDGVWNDHRPEIERLYQTRELQGEDGVIAWMSRNYGFKARKSQYEYQFKKWGLRKYLKRKQWQAAIDIVTHREQQGKQSKLVIDGRDISEGRLVRERARYAVFSARRNRAPSPLTSALILVHSPPFSPIDIRYPQIFQTTNGIVNSGLPEDVSPLQVAHSPGLRQDDDFNFNFTFVFPESFSWVTSLDWNLMKSFTQNTKKVIKRPPSLPLECKALFYQSPQVYTALPKSDTDVVYTQYLVAALLNDMQPSPKPNLDDIHEWLRGLPQSTVLRFFKDLPEGHSDVLRERVFAAAIRAGDVATVRHMLTLGINPFQAINIGDVSKQGAEFPLHKAIENRHFSIATAIVMHVSRVEPRPDLDDILRKILCYVQAISSRRVGFLPPPHWSQIVRVLLDAGAKPTIDCFVAARNDLKLARQILEDYEDGVQGWIKGGILRSCLSWFNPWSRHGMYTPANDSLIRLILLYLLQEKITQVLKHDPATLRALWTAFLEAAQIRHIWAMDVILSAASSLELKLGHPLLDLYTNAALVSAYHKLDWLLASQIESKHTSQCLGLRVLVHDHKPHPDELYRDETNMVEENENKNDHDDPRREGAEQETEGLEEEPDLFSAVVEILDMAHRAREKNENPIDIIPAGVCDRLAQRLRTSEVTGDATDFMELLSRATLLRYDDIAMALYILLDNSAWRREALFSLLEKSRVDLIGGIMSEYPHLHDALLCARNEGDFNALDDLLYRMQTFTFPGQLSLKSDMSQQIALRVLSYHAIHTKDYPLFRWLLKSGLQPCELSGTYTDDAISIYEYSSNISKQLQTSDNGTMYRLPSLLAVAASQNNTSLIECLWNEGVETTDSLALMRAASCNADEEVVNMLSGRTRNEVKRRKDFGVAAMRAAIRKENYGMLTLLLNVADINGFESLAIEDAEGMPQWLPSISPLGEAISGRNLKAARFLIEKGADLNGLVARGNYEETSLKNAQGTVLQRASPLIAAIDSENLPMVQLLVENGAEIDHGSRLGLLRTPLQRAAEIGKFDIVQYLLELGAPVDSAPFYSGGTPLQLAAIGGYVGIATLLLEKGADPNHLPAIGHGRTALESATEWSRVDVMSLLVSVNVNFDLVVDENGETQYKRAMDFAEKRGQMAAKRFLERLRMESCVDLLNF